MTVFCSLLTPRNLKEHMKDASACIITKTPKSLKEGTPNEVAHLAQLSLIP